MLEKTESRPHWLLLLGKAKALRSSVASMYMFFYFISWHSRFVLLLLYVEAPPHHAPLGSAQRQTYSFCFPTFPCVYFIYFAVNKKLVNSNRFYFTTATAWEFVYNGARLFYRMRYDALALIFLSMNRNTYR